jgi:hypothetical protein
MLMATDSLAPKLAPPGAGLPRAELWLSRLGMALIGRWLSRAAASRWFADEGRRILAIVGGLVPEAAARRVLIDRLWGLEDSSRHWSALMVLDHLVITGTTMVEIIESLAAKQTFDRQISTAHVKPDPAVDSAIIARFERFAAEYPQRIARLGTLSTQARHAHPWFGPLTAHGWHVLAAVHQSLHRRQLARIVAGLPRERVVRQAATPPPPAPGR